MNIQKRKYAAIIVATLFALGVYFFGKREQHYLRINSVVWTTEYHITYQSPRDMTDSVNIVLNTIDNTLSMFNSKSTVSRINANDSTVAPHPYVGLLLNRSKEISKESNGYFDPTVAPLVNLWGFGTSHTDQLPTQEQIADVLQYVGISKIDVDAQGNVHKQYPQSVIDLSSIAKGFACDEIGRMFERNGISNYLIEIGGEIAMRGVNPQGEDWHISIDQPIKSNDEVIHQSALVLALSNKGIATSGNYRNYYEKDGKSVSHIINPITGHPETSNILSATIIAPTCADADAYATACMAMGLKRSISMVNANHNISAMFIYTDANGKLQKWYSGEIKSMIVE